MDPGERKYVQHIVLHREDYLTWLDFRYSILVQDHCTFSSHGHCKVKVWAQPSKEKENILRANEVGQIDGLITIGNCRAGSQWDLKQFYFWKMHYTLNCLQANNFCQ